MAIKAATNGQVVQVHFYEQVDGKYDFFFGSLKAIFSRFTAEQIGCTLGTLYEAKITNKNIKRTKTCFIAKQPVVRVSQNQ